MSGLKPSITLRKLRVVSSVPSLTSLRHHPRRSIVVCRGRLVLPKRKQARDTNALSFDEPRRARDYD